MDLTIENQEFNLRFQPDVTSTTTVATRLCTEKGPSFGVTNANFAFCVKTVTDYLNTEINK